MRNLIVFLILTGFLGAQTRPGQEEMRADLDQLVAAIRSDWSYLEHRAEGIGLELDRLAAEARARIDAGTTVDDFRDILAEFVAALRDGHAGLSFPGPRPAARLRPFELVRSGEHFLVGRATWGLEKEGGPAPGDRVLKIDGEEPARIYERISRRIFASTDSGLEFQTLASMVRTEAEEVRLNWVDRDGEERSASIPTLAKYRAMRGGPVPRGNWDLGFPAEKVALLRIWSFAAPDQKAWRGASVEQRDEILASTRAMIDRRIDEIAKMRVETLILDLRRNPGGTDLLGIHLAKQLLADGFVYFRLSAKRDGRWTEPGGLPYARDETMTGFDGRVIALIDGGVFSTADNFLRALSDLHPDFATVGRATGGGTGAPRPSVTLAHSKATIRLCTQRVRGPKSGIIEGVGTIPDHPVTWTADDLRSGRDPDLELALRLATKAQEAPAEKR